MLASLDYTTSYLVVRESLKMEDEYRWNRFDDSELRNLLACFSRASRADLHDLGL